MNSSPSLIRWTRADTWHVLALIGLTVLMMAPYLFTSPTPLMVANSTLGTDLTREFYPLVKSVLDASRETGQIPTWRTYSIGGFPLVGHPMAPLFYPVNWMTLFLPTTLWFNLHTTLHLFWAGLAAYLCLRWLTDVQPNAALVGALIFGHAPRLMALISGGHGLVIVPVTWFPWVWLSFHLFYQRGQLIHAVLLGVALAMHTLTNGFYLAVMAVVLPVCAPFYLRSQTPGVWLRRSVVGGVVSLGVMTGLSAVQVLPMLAVIQESHRTTLTLADSMSLDPSMLVGMFFPFKLPIAEWFLYLGGGTILLALYGAMREWRRARWWLLGILGLLILSVGTNTPVYTFLYQTVPGFSLFRVPQRFYSIAVFAVATLAALGVQRWLDDPQFSKAFRLGTLGLVIFYLGSMGLSAALNNALPFHVFPYALALPLMALVVLFTPRLMKITAPLPYALLLIVLLADLWIANHNLIRPAAEADELRGDPLVMAIQPMMNPGERTFAPYGRISLLPLVEAGIPAADGSDPVQIRRYATFLARATGCDFTGYSVGAPATRASAVAVQECPVLKANLDLLRMLNVRVVILPADAPAPAPSAVEVFRDSERAAWDIGPGAGRAWLTTQVNRTEPTTCLDNLTAHPAVAQVEADIPAALDAGAAPGRVQVIDRRVPNGEAFSVEAAGPALLVRSEAYESGWQVRLNGAAGAVILVNCTLQGVWLPGAGSYEVVFTYAPATFPLGAVISGVTALLVLVFIGWGWSRRAPA